MLKQCIHLLQNQEVESNKPIILHLPNILDSLHVLKNDNCLSVKKIILDCIHVSSKVFLDLYIFLEGYANDLPINEACVLQS